MNKNKTELLAAAVDMIKPLNTRLQFFNIYISANRVEFINTINQPKIEYMIKGQVIQLTKSEYLTFLDMKLKARFPDITHSTIDQVINDVKTGAGL
jgi:hypothetical protein